MLELLDKPVDDNRRILSRPKRIQLLGLLGSPQFYDNLILLIVIVTLTPTLIFIFIFITIKNKTLTTLVSPPFGREWATSDGINCDKVYH